MNYGHFRVAVNFGGPEWALFLEFYGSGGVRRFCV